MEGMTRQTMTPGTNNPRCIGSINLTLQSSGTDVLLEDVDSTSLKYMWLTLYKTSFKINSTQVTTSVIPSKGPQTCPELKAARRQQPGQGNVKINPSRSQNWRGGYSHHEHHSSPSKNLRTVIAQLYSLWARRTHQTSAWKLPGSFWSLEG